MPLNKKELASNCLNYQGEKPGDAPRPCYAVAYRCTKREDWQSDFRGQVELEDGRWYTIGVSIGITPEGEDFLRVYLRPRHLEKTPVTPTRLEVVT